MAEKPKPPIFVGGKKVGDDNAKCITIAMSVGFISGVFVAIAVYTSLMEICVR